MMIKYMLKERLTYRNLYDEKKIHNTQTVGCGKDIGVGDLPTPYFLSFYIYTIIGCLYMLPII